MSPQPKDLEGYVRIFSGEGDDGFGTQIFVKRPKELAEALNALPNVSDGASLSPREEEASRLNHFGNNILNALRVQAAHFELNRKRQQYVTRAAFEKTFLDAGFDLIFVEEIPNGYHRPIDPESVNNPWYVFTTCLGRFKVGWRRSVIHLDWAETILRAPRQPFQSLKTVPSGELLFPQESTTRFENGIHAGSYLKLTEYLKVLLSYPGRA